MSNVIKIDNLNKSYGNIKAVNNLSFRVKDGELFDYANIPDYYKTRKKSYSYEKDDYEMSL